MSDSASMAEWSSVGCPLLEDQLVAESADCRIGNPGARHTITGAFLAGLQETDRASEIPVEGFCRHQTRQLSGQNVAFPVGSLTKAVRP
jgi:hypothetical protein